MFLCHINLKFTYIMLIIICIYVKKERRTDFRFSLFIFLYFCKNNCSTIILHLLKGYSTDLASHRIELIVLHSQ